MQPAPRRPTTSRAADLWPLALLLIAGFAAYANSFSGPFVFDDLPAITENTTIRSFATAFTPPLNGSSVVGRPLVNFSFAVKYAIGGHEPVGYHVVNLLIHLLAGLLLYGVVRRTLAGATLRRAEPEARLVAAGAALLWTVHPLQTESVTLVVQRTESLFGLWVLATLWAFIRTTETPGSRFWTTLTVIACLAGVATKEAMVVAPVLVLLYDRTFVSGTFAAARRQRRWLHLMLFGTWIPLAGLVAASWGSRPVTGVSSWHYLLTQCEGIARYLKLSFWPDPLVVDYGILVVTDPREVLGRGLLLVTLATAGAIAVWRSPKWGFLAAWFFVILAPSSSVLPLPTQTTAEHRMYLPLAALTTAAAIGCHALLRSRSLVVFGAIGALFVTLTYRRNQDYRDGITLWTDTVAKFPQSARAHNNLGKALLDAGHDAESFARFLEAERLNPTAPDTQANLGLCYERTGRLDAAEAHYREAIRLQAGCVSARINLGGILIDSHRLAEALPFVEETVRLLPEQPQAHINLGVALLESQRAADAIGPLRTAVRLDPNDAKAHGNLANALALSGRLDEAVTHYEAALRLNPDYAIAHENYGLLLLNRGSFREAIAQFEAALRVNPDNAMTRVRLDYAREQVSRSQNSPGR